jgi:hypothetical protein
MVKAILPNNQQVTGVCHKTPALDFAMRFSRMNVYQLKIAMAVHADVVVSFQPEVADVNRKHRVERPLVHAIGVDLGLNDRA